MTASVVSFTNTSTPPDLPGRHFRHLHGWPAAESEVAAINAKLPGSARLCGAGDLAALGWHDLDPGAVGVIEPDAGYTNPRAFRQAVRAELSHRPGVRVEALPGKPLTDQRGSPRCRIGTESRQYDGVVVAAGAWTPELVGAPGAYRVKAIQYALHPASGPRPTFFVDDTTGLYGRPTEDGHMLLGIPVPAYGGPPTGGAPDRLLDDRAVAIAARRLPDLRLGPAATVVRAADCYADPPTLALRPVEGRNGLLTFTGGSGASAKTVLAASRLAARDVLAALRGRHDDAG